MWEAMADEGWKLAAQAAAKTSAAVFADLGPAPDTEALPAAQIYTALAERFAALGAKNFLFETLSSDAGVAEAARQIKEAVPDAFVLVSFAVLPDGYTREGMYCKDLARRMQEKRHRGCRGPELRVGTRCHAHTGKAAGGHAAPVGHAQRGLSRCHPDAGEVSGQAGVLCKGAGPSGPRGHGSDPGRLLRHTPRHIVALRAEWTACPWWKKRLRQKSFPP